MSIYKKLLTIQQHIDSFVKNKKAFNYSYVDGNQVLNEIRPLMNQNQLILKQEITSITNERMDYVTSKGVEKTEILSMVMMKFTWVDCETGEKDENLFGANGMNDFDKGVGSSMTYGERYFLLKYFHIPTDADDIDGLKRDDAPKADSRPWLNEGTIQYTGAIEKLRAGTTTIEKIESVMRLSKSTKTKLLNEIKTQLNATH